jgi:tetratricopeptide (TPR) repeat protein
MRGVGAGQDTAGFSVKAGRNDPCPCGSGRKYKKCCTSKVPPPESGPDVDRLFAEALRANNEGRLKQVEDLCGQILAFNPSHAVTLNLLGVVVFKTGRNELAAKLLRRAVDENPSVACFRNSLGFFLQKLDKIEDALSEYRQALRLAPDHVNTLTNLGRFLGDLGRPEEGLPYLEKAAALAPAETTVRMSLGLILHELGRPEEGLRQFQKAVELAPQSVDILKNCATVLAKWKRWVQAEPYYERWVELDPASTEARLGFGHCCFYRGLPRKAAVYYAEVLAIEPDSAMAANNLGSCLLSECHYSGALTFFQMAANLQPDCVPIWTNLGNVLKEFDLVETALRCYDRALSLEPEHVEARWGRSLCLLAMGRLAEGWTEYEWGWKSGARTPVRPFSLPRWNGQNPAGKTILVWMEQGLGDSILFASMLPDLIRAGAHCIVETEWRLRALFARSFPTAEVVTATDPPQAPTQKPGIDFQIPLGSLAQWFRTNIESFPQEPVYLVPDPVRVSHWRKRVDALGDGLKVGICWRSMLNKGPRAIYYPQLNQFGPILTTPGVRFVNLQYDQCEPELREAERIFGVPIYRWEELDLKNDIEGAAALTSTLDLVISVDSTPVEIAAAMGMPTWVIARNAGWAYFGQNYSPWHPSCQCFFCGATDSWEPTIERVATELQIIATHESLPIFPKMTDGHVDTVIAV